MVQVGMLLSDVPQSVTPSQQFKDILRIVDAAQEEGMTYVAIGQHFLYGDLRWLQPVPLLARLAAHVEPNVKLAAQIMIGALYHPVMLAEEVATLDIVHRGSARVRHRARLPARRVRLLRCAIHRERQTTRRDARDRQTALDRRRGLPSRPVLATQRGQAPHQAGPRAPSDDLGRRARNSWRASSRPLRGRVRMPARDAAARGSRTIRHRCQRVCKAKQALRAAAAATQHDDRRDRGQSRRGVRPGGTGTVHKLLRTRTRRHGP